MPRKKRSQTPNTYKRKECKIGVMKKTNLIAITTLLLLGASFFSCSNSSGGPQGQPQEQPQVQSRPNVTLNASLSALDIAKKMECGWNLGNSFDYRFGSGNYPWNSGLGAETAWGEVLTTEQIIKTGIHLSIRKKKRRFGIFVNIRPFQAKIPELKLCV